MRELLQAKCGAQQKLFTSHATLRGPATKQRVQCLVSLRYSNALRFCDYEKAIHGCWRLNLFRAATRPPHFDLLDFARRAKAEVWTLIRARGKATTRYNISALTEAVCGDVYLRADGIARASGLLRVGG